MQGAGALLLAMGLGVSGLGCGLDSWFAKRGVSSFGELDRDEAQKLLADPACVLVQAEEPTWTDRRVAGALIVSPSGPLPDPLAQREGTVVVLAHEPRAGRRLAAHLVRAGRSRVAVVRGGIDAWRRDAVDIPKAGSTGRSGSATLPRLARPRGAGGDTNDGGSPRDHGSEL